MEDIDCNANDNTVKPCRLSDKFDHLIDETRHYLTNTLRSNEKYRDTYYQEDVDRMMRQDFRVRRYLLKQNGSVSQAVDSMISTFQWIKSNNLREIDDSYFPKETRLLGCIFRYERDLDGRPTVYNRVKLNVYSREMVPGKKLVVSYNLLKADDESDENGMTIIIDLADTPWSALEISVAKYIADLNKYFPFALGQSFVTNVPTFGKAFLRVLKYAYPPESRPEIITVDQLVKYIDINNLPNFLGGKCTIPYCGPEVVHPKSPTFTDYCKKLGISKKRIQEIYEDNFPPLILAAREAGWYSDELMEKIKLEAQQ